MPKKPSKRQKGLSEQRSGDSDSEDEADAKLPIYVKPSNKPESDAAAGSSDRAEVPNDQTSSSPTERHKNSPNSEQDRVDIESTTTTVAEPVRSTTTNDAESAAKLQVPAAAAHVTARENPDSEDEHASLCRRYCEQMGIANRKFDKVPVELLRPVVENDFDQFNNELLKTKGLNVEPGWRRAWVARLNLLPAKL